MCMQANKHSNRALFFLFGTNLVKIQFFIKLAEFFYKFAENREFFQGRFLPYKLGIEREGADLEIIFIFFFSRNWERGNLEFITLPYTQEVGDTDLNIDLVAFSDFSCLLFYSVRHFQALARYEWTAECISMSDNQSLGSGMVWYHMLFCGYGTE